MGKEWSAKKNTAKICDSQIYCVLTINTKGTEEARVKALCNKNNYQRYSVLVDDKILPHMWSHLTLSTQTAVVLSVKK